MPIPKGRFQICQNPNYTLFKVLEKHLAQDSLWGKVSITERCERLDGPPHALYKLGIRMGATKRNPEWK